MPDSPLITPLCEGVVGGKPCRFPADCQLRGAWLCKPCYYALWASKVEAYAKRLRARQLKGLPETGTEAEGPVKE